MSAPRSLRRWPPPARRCFFLHPAEASHGDLGMVTSGDVILALSWSGETAELRDIIHYSRRHRVPLVAITSRGESALGGAPTCR